MPTEKDLPDGKPRDIAIGAAMCLFIFFSFLYGGSHHFPTLAWILFILFAGSIPWMLYNVAAYLAGWERSHILHLLWYWGWIILNTVLG
jgi:hypothetical protein